MAAQLLPKELFFTNGVGVHKDRLSSFELALRDAGIEKANLVTVSSIFPPHCREIKLEEWRRRGLWHRTKDHACYLINEIL